MQNRNTDNRLANAIVLESGPSTGKTSLIRRFRSAGYNCIDEVATPLIQCGVTPDQGRLQFQRVCLEMQSLAEQEVWNNPDKLFFMDRGLLIGRAHFRYDNLPVPPVYDTLDVSHYALAFIVEHNGQFFHNGIRPKWEDLGFTIAMTDLVEEEYQRRGIRTVRVPSIPAQDVGESIGKRVEFILSKCRELVPFFDSRIHSQPLSQTG